MAVADVIVAGHICLDIIPTFPSGPVSLGDLMVPGKLVDVGSALLSTGGPVPNTGLALHRLGVPVELMGKVGDDLFGRAILALLKEAGAHLADGMIVAPGQASSYSIVISPPGSDRVFLHCTGTNDTFAADDIKYDALPAARLFHFGYPPLMKRMYGDDGSQLETIFRRIKARGMTTSLDMARPDPAGAAARADWPGILGKCLPHVDVFLPSIDEMLFMLDRPKFDAFGAGGKLSPAVLTDLSGRLLDMGCGVVVLKLGVYGCYVRTSLRPQRLEAMGAAAPKDLAAWTGRELLVPCLKANVVGTTGAGDCTIAGFLAGMLHGQAPEAVLASATAVGACSVEAPDANSGVPSWQAVQARLAAGWQRHKPTLEMIGWRASGDGVFAGPQDAFR